MVVSAAWSAGRCLRQGRPSAGRGLAGMAQHVEMYHGELAAEPPPSRGAAGVTGY
ncbi:hypothetical protein [Amycolatopsis vastitatis]|uniref:hypothetical protein n=1 Tax=Amycolatopsis vastitatis TaxID=1905142 RepID=UPI001304044D|nr:hypothetical protein [Amycolatopsis vastitatis]